MPDLPEDNVLPTAYETLATIVQPNEGSINLRALKTGEIPCNYFARDSADFASFLDAHSGSGWDLYFGMAAHRSDATNGKLESCIHLNALYSDFDYKRFGGREATWEQRADTAIEWLNGFVVIPSMVIASGGGLYPIWLLRQPVRLPEELDRAKRVLRRLAIRLKADMSAIDVTRILRIPGTRNCKYQPPREVEYVGGNPDRKYEIADIEASLTDVVDPEDNKNETGPKAARVATNREEIQSALESIDPDPRDNWLCVGMALQAELGEAGRELWDAWSKQSVKFDARVQDYTWKSFDPDGGIGIGTLFKLARDAGWQPPGAIAEPRQDAAVDLYRFRPVAELRKEEEKKAASRVAFVENLLFAGDASMLVGRPEESGKSTFASAMVKCLRTGGPFGGLFQCRKLEVVAYAAYERNGRRVRERFSAWGIEEGVMMAYQPKPFKAVKQLMLWLEDQIITTKAQALILDNLQSLLGLEDTDKLGTVSTAMQELNNLARRTNCAILALVWQSLKVPVSWTGPIQFMGSSAYQGLAEITIQVGLRNEVRCMRVRVRGEPELDPVAYDINLETGDMKCEVLADVEADRNLEKVMAFLREREAKAEGQAAIQGATVDEIAKALKTRYQTVLAALSRGLMKGAFAKSGAGKKGDPSRWLYTPKNREGNF